MTEMAGAARGEPSARVPEPTQEPFGSSAIGHLFARKREYAASRLADFRSHLEATESTGRGCADEMLCRFLESHVSVKGTEIKGVSLRAAGDSLAATVRWRADFGADTLRSCACCDADPFAHCFFSVGLDRRGWEVAYCCAGRTTKKDATSITRHFVAFLEATFARHDAPSHFIILLDLHGFGLGDLDPRVAVRCITVLLSHYPDRVAQVAILDAPWVFAAVWAVLKQAIDPLSQQKACMLTKGAAVEDYLDRYLTDEQAAFMRDQLRTRARPAFDSFSPIAATCRRSLGPCDAFTREMRCRAEARWGLALPGRGAKDGQSDETRAEQQHQLVQQALLEA